MILRYGFVIATKANDKGANVVSTADLLNLLDVYDDLTRNLTVTEDGVTWGFRDMCRRAGNVKPWSEQCDVTSPLAWSA